MAAGVTDQTKMKCPTGSWSKLAHDKRSLTWHDLLSVQGAYYPGDAIARTFAFAADRDVGLFLLPFGRPLVGGSVTAGATPAMAAEVTDRVWLGWRTWWGCWKSNSWD